MIAALLHILEKRVKVALANLPFPMDHKAARGKQGLVASSTFRGRKI